MLETANLLGAWVTYAIYLFCALTFICRLLGRPRLGHWFGYPLMIMALPLAYLLGVASQLERQPLYYVQISLMLLFLLVELLLDYVLNVDFRHTRWMVISYVVLFFAATGGMLGVAGAAGSAWAIAAVIMFFAMAGLAFTQRAATGL